MSDIEIIQNRSFIYKWNIPNIIESIDNKSSEMKPTTLNFLISENDSYINIYKNNNIVNTLKYGKGFGISTNKDTGQVEVVASISNVSHFEIGDYEYTIKIYDKDKNIFFEKNGTISVKENKSGETLYERTPFDLFDPFNELIK